MEDRLVPLNGLLGLVVADGLYPSPLKEMGYTLVGLEVPTTTEFGSIVIDALLYRPATGELVACEVKSGANVEDAQARRYAAIDATALVQTAHVTLTQRVRPWVSVLYVCLDRHADRIRLGLTEAGTTHHVLALGRERTRLVSAPSASSSLAGAVAGVALPAPPPTRPVALHRGA